MTTPLSLSPITANYSVDLCPPAIVAQQQTRDRRRERALLISCLLPEAGSNSNKDDSPATTQTAITVVKVLPSTLHVLCNASLKEILKLPSEIDNICFQHSVEDNNKHLLNLIVCCANGNIYKICLDEQSPEESSKSSAKKKSKKNKKKSTSKSDKEGSEKKSKKKKRTESIPANGNEDDNNVNDNEAESMDLFTERTPTAPSVYFFNGGESEDLLDSPPAVKNKRLRGGAGGAQGEEEEETRSKKSRRQASSDNNGAANSSIDYVTISMLSKHGYSIVRVGDDKKIAEKKGIRLLTAASLPLDHVLLGDIEGCFFLLNTRPQSWQDNNPIVLLSSKVNAPAANMPPQRRPSAFTAVCCVAPPSPSGVPAPPMAISLEKNLYTHLFGASCLNQQRTIFLAGDTFGCIHKLPLTAAAMENDEAPLMSTVLTELRDPIQNIIPFRNPQSITNEYSSIAFIGYSGKVMILSTDSYLQQQRLRELERGLLAGNKQQAQQQQTGSTTGGIVVQQHEFYIDKRVAHSFIAISTGQLVICEPSGGVHVVALFEERQVKTTTAEQLLGAEGETARRFFLVGSSVPGTGAGSIQIRPLPISSDVRILCYFTQYCYANTATAPPPKSFMLLTQRGRLMNINLPDIKTLDEQASKILSLDEIQRRIRTSLAKINKVTREHALYMEVANAQNSNIFTLNTAMHLVRELKTKNTILCQVYPVNFPHLESDATAGHAGAAPGLLSSHFRHSHLHTTTFLKCVLKNTGRYSLYQNWMVLINIMKRDEGGGECNAATATVSTSHVFPLHSLERGSKWSVTVPVHLQDYSRICVDVYLLLNFPPLHALYAASKKGTKKTITSPLDQAQYNNDGVCIPLLSNKTFDLLHFITAQQQAQAHSQMQQLQYQQQQMQPHQKLLHSVTSKNRAFNSRLCKLLTFENSKNNIAFLPQSSSTMHTLKLRFCIDKLFRSSFIQQQHANILLELLNREKDSDMEIKSLAVLGNPTFRTHTEDAIVIKSSRPIIASTGNSSDLDDNTPLVIDISVQCMNEHALVFVHSALLSRFHNSITAVPASGPLTKLYIQRFVQMYEESLSELVNQLEYLRIQNAILQAQDSIAEIFAGKRRLWISSSGTSRTITTTQTSPPPPPTTPAAAAAAAVPPPPPPLQQRATSSPSAATATAIATATAPHSFAVGSPLPSVMTHHQNLLLLMRRAQQAHARTKQLYQSVRKLTQQLCLY